MGDYLVMFYFIVWRSNEMLRGIRNLKRIPEKIYANHKKWYDMYNIGGNFYGINVYWGRS